MRSVTSRRLRIVVSALHKKIALKAQARGESLNQYVAEVLTQT
jgi:predicted HicB family RNase H-like nuclease